MPPVKVPSCWKELVEDIHRVKGVVVILGASDTGKTTLAFYLAGELLKRRNRVSIVSADVGQCAFGPPATISMAMLEPGAKFLQEVPAHSMYFVGSTSPVGHFLQTVVGVKKQVERSLREGAEVVVVDTSGLVSGGAAWELKSHKIELAGARCVVAIQKERRELEDILLPLERRGGIKLHRLPVSEHAKARSYEQRREYRRQRYEEYFRDAGMKSLSLKDVSLVNPYDMAIQEGDSNTLRRRLVGLNDCDNFSIALGIIEDVDLQGGTIRLETPLRAARDDVGLIRLGSVVIEDGWYDRMVR
ncbi:MAG: hypothetical protein NOU37_02685 [Candidatus Brocadiales bacterium]|nr:hypothetical protein [Candidatus Bathyanammoxibius amoris]